MNFKIGDKVRLVSGGPKMTIEEIDDFSLTGGTTNGIKCVWFSEEKGSQKIQERVFAAAVLEIY